MPIDIVLFGVIALVLIFRLLNTLGKEDKDDGRTRKDVFGAYRKSMLSRQAKRVLDLKLKLQSEKDKLSAARQKKEPEPAEPSDATVSEEKRQGVLAPLGAVFPDLEEKTFLKGATWAFESILQAYAHADERQLSLLVDSQVFTRFRSDITERKKQGQRLEISLVNCEAKRIVAAHLKDNVAQIAVEFSSKQCRLLFDTDNKLIEGDPNAEDLVKDQWTFQRALDSRDPTWFLCATAAEKKPRKKPAAATEKKVRKKPAKASSADSSSEDSA